MAGAETPRHRDPSVNEERILTNTHPSTAWTTYLRQPAVPSAVRPEDFDRLMRHDERFPRAAAYNPVWVRQNLMGPNALWLMEDLAERLDFQPGQRVLDLGCGSAITSIFLAREYGVRVHAVDLWIEPTSNLARIREAGVDALVAPVEAEAHALPFARGFFDAIVSVDAYHYFGTDIRYLSYVAQFTKPGGRLGVVVPGNGIDPDDRPDEVNGPFPELYGADWFTFRSATWWGRHWRRTTGVTVEEAAMVEDGWNLWHRHHEAAAAWTGEAIADIGDERLLSDERGRELGFVRLMATVTGERPLSLGPGRYESRLA